MEITEVKRLWWGDAANTILNALVVTDTLGEIEMCVNANYDTVVGLTLFNEAIAGKYGDIDPYTPPTDDEIRAAMPSLEKWKLEAALMLRDEEWDIPAKISALPAQQRIVFNSQWRNRNDFERMGAFVEEGVRAWFSLSPSTMDEIWNEGLAL